MPTIHSLNSIQQLKITLFEAPFSITRVKRSSLLWMFIYCFMAIIVFGLFVWLMTSNQQAIKDAFLDYLFPQSWHGISEKLANFLFESQTKSVLTNMILSGSLVLASIFLFPIKEKYSAAFEKQGGYQNGEAEEFPLIYQAWEEIKLLLIYLTAQSLILWIGYYPYLWTTWISIILSYVFLFFTFGLDFISPTLQRHRIAYSLILKVLLKRPVLTISFGALFSLPVILLSLWVFTFKDLSLIEIASILFITNIAFLNFAIPAGTHVASFLLPLARQTTPPKNKTVIRGYSAMTVVLIICLSLHAQLILSLHHKSQLLKAQYDIDWSSFDYQFPSFSELAKGKAFSHLSFDMVINNPTEFDIVIENSQIFFEQRENEIATFDLNGFELPSGEKRRIKIELNSNSDLSQLSNFANLLDDWRVEMHLQVWPGIPFVFNIIEP